MEKQVEARKEFIRKLAGVSRGGHQILADRYGLPDRRNIFNCILAGFTDKLAPIMIEDAIKRNIPVLPELYDGRKKKIRSYSTPIGKFIRALADQNGGTNGLAKKIGCPVSALGRMTEDKGHLIKKYIPALRSAAIEAGPEMMEMARNAGIEFQEFEHEKNHVQSTEEHATP